jgi:hypothetical protein
VLYSIPPYNRIVRSHVSDLDVCSDTPHDLDNAIDKAIAAQRQKEGE